ncbi:MAG: DNA repair protein RadC [Verrucomicrobiales bacterium]|nr:DNA repair protein RadC [Verrucomicrobiales bacterium]
MDPLDYASNAELLGRLAGKDAAATLLQEHGSLTSLATASFDDLQRVPGVGKSKAAAIKSAFLLAQRLSREAIPESPLVDSPIQVANLLREENRTYQTEHFQALLLNTRRRLIRAVHLSTGTLNEVHVHARDVFRAAISANASAIIVVHNHPSGDPSPSEADIRVTRELLRASRLLRIELIDHVILGRATPERPQDYVSLRELGFWAEF